MEKTTMIAIRLSLSIAYTSSYPVPFQLNGEVCYFHLDGLDRGNSQEVWKETLSAETWSA
jgi:hypothetical protein